MAHEAKNVSYLVFYRGKLADYCPRGSDLISKKRVSPSGLRKFHLYSEFPSSLTACTYLIHLLYLFHVLIFLSYHYLY